MSRPEKDDSIEALAAAWLAQRDDGMTPEQENEFSAWQSADPRRQAAVARLEKTWHILQNLRDFRPAAQAHPDRDLLLAKKPGSLRFRPLLFAVAGLAAAIALAAIFLAPSTAKRPGGMARTYLTNADSFQKVPLPDGSVITMNGDSELRVTYTPDERRVSLLRGEAHFEVARDPARPFWVEAGAMTVRAVGTAFNVRVQTETVEVLVTHGRVQVDDTRARTSATKALADDLSQRLNAFLDVGDRLRVALAQSPNDTPNPVIEKLQPEAVRKEMAWQDAWLVFADTPLRDALAQFNARNSTQVEVEDAILAALPIGGNFRAENVEAFVRLLVTTNDIVADRAAPDHIVLRARTPTP